MPPRGIKKGTKRARQYEKIKRSQKKRGTSERRAEEIAARTVQKERARAGESRQRSRTSTRDIASGRPALGQQRPAGPDPRAALQPGQEAQHRGSLADEQAPAPGRRQPQAGK